MVEIHPMKPLFVETFAEFPQLGRFAVRDMKQAAAIGVVKSVVKKENTAMEHGHEKKVHVGKTVDHGHDKILRARS